MIHARVYKGSPLLLRITHHVDKNHHIFASIKQLNCLHRFHHVYESVRCSEKNVNSRSIHCSLNDLVFNYFIIAQQQPAGMRDKRIEREKKNYVNKNLMLNDRAVCKKNTRKCFNSFFFSSHVCKCVCDSHEKRRERMREILTLYQYPGLQQSMFCSQHL